MADLSSMFAQLPGVLANSGMIGTEGGNVPTVDPGIALGQSGLAQILASIIPGSTPEMFGGSSPAPAAVQAGAGGMNAGGAATAPAPGPVAPPVAPNGAAPIAPAPAPPAAPPPNLGISTPLAAHGPPGAMPPGANSLPPLASSPLAGPAASTTGPAAPTPPTPPSHHYTPLAKALMILASLGGGGRVVQGFAEGQNQYDQQKFANDQQVYNNQVAAQTQMHAQTVAQLHAHEQLFDQMGSMDPASQQTYLNSLSPQQLSDYGVNKAAFYDKAGNFVPVTAADKQDSAAAVQRAQTAALKALGDRTVEAQQAVKDNMDDATFESTYGIPKSAFTPSLTAKGQNDVNKLQSYSQYRQARIEFMNAQTSQNAQRIQQAGQRLVGTLKHLTTSDADKARHELAMEGIAQQGLTDRRDVASAQLGIARQRLNDYEYRAQKDTAIAPLYQHLNHLQTLISEESKAKDVALGNPALDQGTADSMVTAHDNHIAELQKDAAATAAKIDAHIQQKTSVSAKMSTVKTSVNTSGMPPSGSAVPHPNVPKVAPLPITGKGSTSLRPMKASAAGANPYMDPRIKTADLKKLYAKKLLGQ